MITLIKITARYTSFSVIEYVSRTIFLYVLAEVSSTHCRLETSVVCSFLLLEDCTIWSKCCQACYKGDINNQSMLYLTFISLGDLPKGAFSEIADKFHKQMSPYVKFSHIVVADESKIKAQVPDGDFVIVLDEAGKTMSSHEFAKLISDFEDGGQHLTVILSDAKGLSDQTKKASDSRLSLSPMTTTHDLAHLFFLEQLYRAMTIIRGKEYHY